MKKYIAYYRVSTKQQGLGLDAQQSIVSAYIKANGGRLIAEYSEKESGKETTHRAQLAAALAAHKAEGATLVVAKLDRLSRNVADVFNLVKAKSNRIEVCDMDASDTMMLGIFATLAQKERELISERTKAALKVRKEQGIKLGNPRASEHMKAINHMGAQARKDNATANDANRKAYAAIKFMQGTLRDKASYLNENGFTTPRGGQWSAMQVLRLIERFAA